MPRWSVDIIRHRAEHLGTVVAANEKDAIKVAVATFDVEPARRNRITVTKISDKDTTRASPCANTLSKMDNKFVFG